MDKHEGSPTYRQSLQPKNTFQASDLVVDGLVYQLTLLNSGTLHSAKSWATLSPVIAGRKEGSCYTAHIAVKSNQHATNVIPQATRQVTWPC